MSMSNSHEFGAVISRVISLSVKDFRGFRGDHFSLDTNADLVLITGPNGHGKTSLMEALLLLVTGWHGYDDYPKTEKLVSRYGCPVEKLDDVENDESSMENLCEYFELNARVAMENKEGATLEDRDLYLKRNSKGDVLDPDSPRVNYNEYPLCPVALPDSPVNDSILAARLCGFFQDRVGQLFDETTRGTTLRDVFEPLPLWLSDVKDYLQEAGESRKENGEAHKVLKKKLRELEINWTKKELDLKQNLQRRSRENLQEMLSQAGRTVAPLYEQLVHGKSDWPEFPSQSTNASLTAFAVAVLKLMGRSTPLAGEEETASELPNQLHNILRQENSEQLHNARRAAREGTERTAEIQRQIDQIESKLDRIDREYPNLLSDMGIFNSTDLMLPDALSIFRSLARNAHRRSAVIAESQTGTPAHKLG